MLLIETPTSCCNCPCIDGEYGECQLTNKSVPLYDALDCCPLKPYKEAIPIEWINNWIIEHRYFDTEIVNWLMKDWEKENEANRC